MIMFPQTKNYLKHNNLQKKNSIQNYMMKVYEMMIMNTLLMSGIHSNAKQLEIITIFT